MTQIPRPAARGIKLWRFTAICAATGLALGAIFVAASGVLGVRIAPAPAPRSVAASGIVSATLLSSGKPHYRYSVIPGGVRSAQELAGAMARDGVVAEHYRAVSVAAVRTERVKADRLVHVSYRIADKIYWTKRTLRLNEGETILTDGLTQVRARCGNCISTQPMGPTSEDEPEIAQFDAVIDEPVESVPTADLVAEPSTIVSRDLVPRAESLGLSPFETSPSGLLTPYVPFEPPPTSPPAPVPEPATLLLIGTGLAGLAARRFRRKP